jgi:hypothetical protein
MQSADEQHEQPSAGKADSGPQGSGQTSSNGGGAPHPVRAWSAEEYLGRQFPPKEPLLKGLLHRRDQVALGARRRHGKTSLVTNIAIALAVPVAEFLGYEIPQAFRSLLLILEDDPGEYQEKLQRVIGTRDTGGRIKIVTREDFYQANVRIDVSQPGFRQAVQYWAGQHNPDLIVLDNLAQVIGAEYNDAPRVHELMRFCYELARNHNAAVILPAHPKKEDPDHRKSLLDDSDAFFESIMGSSHFINSTGNLWGLERQLELDRSVFLGGRQRGDGHQGGSFLRMNDEGWFCLLDEAQANSHLVLNTEIRRQAWRLLPDPPATFGYRDGEALVKPVMKSSSTYNKWMGECRRVKVILDAPGGKLCKAAGVKP